MDFFYILGHCATKKNWGGNPTHSVWIGTSDCKWWNSWYLSIIQSKDYKKKIGGMKYLIIKVYVWFLSPDGVLGEIPGFHPADPGSIPGEVFSLFFSTFTLFYPFLEIFKGQKRGAYTTIYQWDQVQSTRILLYFYQN